MSFPRLRSKDCRSGFALLVTITLLAFLVLLLVSLAALTRVETQVASNNQQLSQARQNALMALNVALGKLQAAAGPDQRVTATAEIDPAAASTNRRWTGVWDSEPGSATYGERLAWLVSGTIPDAATVVADPGAAGATATVVRLVGANSADLSTPAASDANRVDVPLQEIVTDTVPGNSAPGGHVIGHFGYWVGDEGVKARVSLVDPWAGSTDPEEKAFRLRLAQRAGIELLDSSTIGSPGTPLAESYPANDAGLGKLLDLKQLPLANTAGQLALADAVKFRFHDLTVSSRSLLADAAQGGLKKDLTAWLANDPADGGVLASGAPTDDSPLFTGDPADSTGFGIPKWGIIRSYSRLQGGPAAPLPPQVQTDRQQGFHPVITYFRLGFSAHAAAPPLLDDGITPDPVASTRLVVQAFPVLVLWNPYNTPIAASSYEFVCGFRWNANVVRFALTKPAVIHKASLLLTSRPRLTSGLKDSNAQDGSSALRRFLRFAVNSPQIGPGESLVFTLDGSGDYQPPGDDGAIALSPNNDPATDRSVYFSDAAITLTPAERNAAGQQIRVYITGDGNSGGPWLQCGLYPPQPPGGDPTVQDMVNQDPYMLFMSAKPAAWKDGSKLNLLTAPAIPTDPSGYFWIRMQMSTPPNPSGANNKYYTNYRWLAQLDPRAPLHLTVDPGIGTGGAQTLIGDNSQSNPNALPNDKFDGNRASAGPSIDAAPPSIPLTDLEIAELLPSAPAPESRFFSLSQLQHANFSLLGQQPGSAVGNSQINITISGAQGIPGLWTAGTTPEAFPATSVKRFYDLSYLLNRALWDHYFFSTIPESLTDAQVADGTFHLPNARHTFYGQNNATPSAASLAGTEAFNTASAHLLVNGGFNVNSTSEQAWRALLASHNKVDTAPGGFNHPYSRFAATLPGDEANTPWSSGYRILSDVQIRSLAQQIVLEVKKRGPFLSLADFVNRRLTDYETGLKGPLQTAIDATDRELAASKRINSRAPFNDVKYQVGPDAYRGSITTTLQRFLADLGADRTLPTASRAAFAPGFLTQADLLNSLGPVLTARSDTFTIRAYGDVQNPATSAVEGRAWCEAVVQRLPEYVESGIDPWVTPTGGSDSETFGRRFKIVSFRWLSPDDL